MLDLYGKMGNYWNKVVSRFKQMKNHGFRPDEYTYSTMIAAYGRG
jgi:pentatricopeptide repeat protein